MLNHSDFTYETISSNRREIRVINYSVNSSDYIILEFSFFLNQCLKE